MVQKAKGRSSLDEVRGGGGGGGRERGTASTVSFRRLRFLFPNSAWDSLRVAVPSLPSSSLPPPSPLLVDVLIHGPELINLHPGILERVLMGPSLTTKRNTGRENFLAEK